MFNNLHLNLLEIDLTAHLALDTRNAPIDKSTGVDVVKILQVGSHVKRKAVHGNIAARLNTYGANLSRPGRIAINPDTRSTSHTPRLDAPLTAYADDGLLDGVYILPQTNAQLLQIQNGITHHLTRAVKGHVATSVDMEKLSTDRAQICLRDEHILVLTAFA